MKLKEWLTGQDMSHAQFAELIEVSSRVTVSRYVGGRIPDPDILKRIVRVTEGAVTPNDFYPTEAA